MVGGLNQDLRYALPQLGRSQAFAAVADCIVRRNRSSLVVKGRAISSHKDEKRQTRRSAIKGHGWIGDDYGRHR